MQQCVTLSFSTSRHMKMLTLTDSHFDPTRGGSAYNTPRPTPASNPRRLVYQVQQRVTIRDSKNTPEIEFDGCFDSLAKAKAKSEQLWKNVYAIRYPDVPHSERDGDSGQRWYETVVIHDQDRTSIWTKRIEFEDDTLVELWVHEKIVK